jgi:hypothetical protein
MPDTMALKRTWSGALLALALLLGCSDGGQGVNGVGTVTQAISPCNETVPANRFIDGFPAYAQCDTTQNSAIYSNNGIDTATSAMGSDWVRTQYSGGYQCTELAHRYLLFKWNVTWIPRGNAGTWCDTMPTADSGVVQTMTPVHGDIMVFAPGSCGADATTGHVAVVDVVGAKVSAVQQNIASRTSYAATCAKCYLHVVANNGSTGSAGAGGVGGGASGGATNGGTSGASVGAGGIPPFGAGGSTGAGGWPSVPPGFGGSPSMPAPGGVAGTTSAPPSSTGGYPGSVAGTGTGGAVSTPTASGGFAGAIAATGATAGAASNFATGNDSHSSCSTSRVGSRRGFGGAALLALALASLSWRSRAARRRP